MKTSPDFRDDNTDNTDLEFMCNYVKQRFPGVYCKPSIVESCMYTVSTINYHTQCEILIILFRLHIQKKIMPNEVKTIVM